MLVAAQEFADVQESASGGKQAAVFDGERMGARAGVVGTHDSPLRIHMRICSAIVGKCGPASIETVCQCCSIQLDVRHGVPQVEASRVPCH